MFTGASLPHKPGSAGALKVVCSQWCRVWGWSGFALWVVGYGQTVTRQRSHQIVMQREEVQGRDTWGGEAPRGVGKYGVDAYHRAALAGGFTYPD